MRRALSLVCAAALSATLLGQAPSARSAPDPDDAEAVLEADADGPVRIRREGGVATFVGAPAGTDVDNPSVNRGTTVSAAARSHLRRYGALIGTDRPGTVLEETRRDRSAAGTDVVRYQQEVDGLPVVGGEVVVTLADDRDLGSLNGNLSAVGQVPAAIVTEQEARSIAIALVGRSNPGRPVVEDQGRWLFDPEAVSWPGDTGARGVWRFEVRVGDAVRRMVLVDDRTGAVLLDVDLIQHIDRVVCDRANDDANLTDPVACTSDFDRTEGSGPSPVADVNDAFDNSGVVSDFYEEVMGLDLTRFIGLPLGEDRHLSSSVRVCVEGRACPYANAFWNGHAMFYGQGYAAADDVVGHEMTHGVVERLSGLLYWDQAGAINESLADIIGEIIDHRNAKPGEDLGNWQIGEDLPGPAIRNVADPTLFNDPDRMTSALWRADPSYLDRGGLHSNSGVGNKAFHLISQGGTFNGQTITGIDAGDPTLTRSALLWVEVLSLLTSFTEYADLAYVLGRSCAVLAEGGTMTADNCTAVQQAIEATEMRSDPVSDPTPDPARTCPQELVKVTLLDSETGADPASSFVAGPGWGRIPETNVNSSYTDNSFSLGTSWVSTAPATTAENSLTGASSIRLPEGQSAFLAFRHWYLLDFDTEDSTPRYWDGGTVEVDDVGDGVAPADVSAHPWENGPTRPLEAPHAGRTAFSGSSRGWVGSRVDLSSYAGKDIKPVFTMRTDASVAFVGWYLDDIEVYTCAPVALLREPIMNGGGSVGTWYRTDAGSWGPTGVQLSYQWLRDGTPISGATSISHYAVAADLGALLSVRVTGSAGGRSISAVVGDPRPVDRGYLLANRPTIQGTYRVGKTLTAFRNVWSPINITFTYQWLRDGKVIKGATGKKRTLTRWDRGHRLQVRVRGVKAGFATRTETSARTPRVR